MRVVSLFAGAGGLDLGFRDAGHQLTWANDNDPDCVATYRRNVGSHVVLGDVCDIPAEAIPQAEIVIGGFPCQGFSIANLKRSPGDERNKLYHQFVRVVRDSRPLYFLAENVKGILSLEGGSAIQRIIRDFGEAGYEVEYQLLDAADYGVPQRRRRVFIVGIRTDLFQKGVRFKYPTPSHCDPNLAGSEGREGRAPWVTVGEALANMPRYGASSVPNHTSSQYKVVHRNFTGHRETDPNRPSPTILARGNGGGGVCAIPHPTLPRRLTVRESATVQTFPMDFEFCGRLNSTYRQVGNAVPPRLAFAFGMAFRELEPAIADVA